MTGRSKVTRKPVLEVAGSHGLCKQKTLKLVATHPKKDVALAAVLDAFGHHPQS